MVLVLYQTPEAKTQAAGNATTADGGWQERLLNTRYACPRCGTSIGEIEPRTFAGMAETVDLLTTLSQERVTTELDKLLQGVAPRAGLEALRLTGALELVLPEVAPMVGCEQNRFHEFDVWGHTLATVEAIAADEDTLRLRRWGAFLHDLGKPAVRHVKANGEWGFYRHETVGAEMAAGLLGRLRFARHSACARSVCPPQIAMFSGRSGVPAFVSNRHGRVAVWIHGWCSV